MRHFADGGFVMLAEDFGHAAGAVLLHAEVAQGIDAEIEGAAEGFAIDLGDAKPEYFVGVLAAGGAREDLAVGKLPLDRSMIWSAFASSSIARIKSFARSAPAAWSRSSREASP